MLLRPRLHTGPHWSSLQSSLELLAGYGGHFLTETEGEDKKMEGREGKGRLWKGSRRGQLSLKGWAGSVCRPWNAVACRHRLLAAYVCKFNDECNNKEQSCFMAVFITTVWLIVNDILDKMFSVSLCLIAELMLQFVSLRNLQNVLCNLAGLGLGWREGQGQVSLRLCLWLGSGLGQKFAIIVRALFPTCTAHFASCAELINCAQH